MVKLTIMGTQQQLSTPDWKVLPGNCMRPEKKKNARIPEEEVKSSSESELQEKYGQEKQHTLVSTTSNLF